MFDSGISRYNRLGYPPHTRKKASNLFAALLKIGKRRDAQVASELPKTRLEPLA
jgi:hypothetical protein